MLWNNQTFESGSKKLIRKTDEQSVDNVLKSYKDSPFYSIDSFAMTGKYRCMLPSNFTDGRLVPYFSEEALFESPGGNIIEK